MNRLWRFNKNQKKEEIGMSMIKCPECGKEISTKAKSCPNCGYPLSKKHSERQSKYYVFNVILIVFGILMALAVLKSNGGLQQNLNAALISWALIIGGVFFLTAFKKKNKVLILVASVFYALSFIAALRSIQIAPAYLMLEIAIGLVLIGNIAFAKKNSII